MKRISCSKAGNKVLLELHWCNYKCKPGETLGEIFRTRENCQCGLCPSQRAARSTVLLEKTA